MARPVGLIGLIKMKLEESTAYVKDCFNGEPASCACVCPFGLDIRSFMEKVEKGRWLPSYKMLRNAVVFPTVVSRLCPQPCQNNCQRASIGDEPIAVRDLEAACVKYTRSRSPENFTIPPKAQRVAVIGAGPSGLSCALNLAQKKYSVTVFEKDAGWGGSLRTNPEFEAFDEDFALQFSAVGADFKFNTEIKSLDDVQDYDAVYIATGENSEAFGLRDSWDPVHLTTAKPSVYMGGGLVGAPLMQAIAQGPVASREMETFFQTGKNAKAAPDLAACVHYLPHDDAEKQPRVAMSSPDGYTEDEAKAEAGRCFKCDCQICKDNCEMIAWFRKMPHKLGVEAYTDSLASSTISKRTLTREAYSCNVCGKCKSVCPVDVDVGALMQASREDRFKAGKNIPAFHDFWIREFDFHSGETFFAAPPKGQKTCEYVFFPGCQLGAAEPDHVLKSYAYLKTKLDVGIIDGCCGAPAYWAGDTGRLSENTERLRDLWDEMGRPTFIYACAYCENVLRLLLPEINLVSLYELMAKDDSVVPARLFEDAAVFDPCTARDDAAVQESVRVLTARAGVDTEELTNPNRCCGYGGHMRLANPALYDEITEHRVEASDKPYIVYCANCREVFRQKDKDCAHILDLIYDIAPGRRAPTLQAKKDNALEVKRQLMKEMTGKDFAPEVHEWDAIKLVIDETLQDELDRKLIIEDDLKEAIYLAEQSGEKFVSDDGVAQCSMVKAVLTYWVLYKELSPGTYEVLSAYIHRMKFSRED